MTQIVATGEKLFRQVKSWQLSVAMTCELLYSYSEHSQNAGFHPRSYHLAIVQTPPSPPMLGFVDNLIVLFLIHKLPGEKTSLCVYYN